LTKSLNALDVVTALMGCGPLVYWNEETGLAIACNGAYLNAYRVSECGNVNNFDCRARDKDLYQTTGAQMRDEAQTWADEMEMEIYIEDYDLDDPESLLECIENGPDGIEAYLLAETSVTAVDIERAQVRDAFENRDNRVTYRGYVVGYVSDLDNAEEEGIDSDLFVTDEAGTVLGYADDIDDALALVDKQEKGG
jgi:hypothetical protein